jgi:5'-nucleotidase
LSAGAVPPLLIFGHLADHLFLSTHAEDAAARCAHFGAATILSGVARRAASNELRIAFDGDAVLFSR